MPQGIRFDSVVFRKQNPFIGYNIDNGEVSEWLKEHAWKVCVGLKPTEGSNPSLSAKDFPSDRGGISFLIIYSQYTNMP